MKNLLTVIQILAERTGNRASSVEEFLGAFRGRLQALNSAQAALIASDWYGASLAALVHATLGPHLGDGSRIDLDVQDLPIGQASAQTVALALHELATNAAKYGALSSPAGRVVLTARVEAGEGGEELAIVWQEDGGPPVQEPETTGFGTSMLSTAAVGRSELIWRPSGLVCRLRLPLTEPEGATP